MSQTGPKTSGECRYGYQNLNPKSPLIIKPFYKRLPVSRMENSTNQPTVLGWARTGVAFRFSRSIPNNGRKAGTFTRCQA